jgi:hypothetical protein
MSQLALDPLRGKYVILPLMNQASIAGASTKVRKIRKKNALAAALDDTEALAFSNPATFSVQSNISIQPTTKVQGVQLTSDSIELALPGVARDQVISAIQSGSAAALPLVRDAMMEVMQAHYLRAETDALQLFPGLSGSAGTTNTSLSFATMLDALTKLLSNNVESEDCVYVLEEKGVADLRALAVAGTGAPLSTIFAGNQADLSFFNHRPDASRNGFRGSFAGIPVYAANKAVMSTANASVDRVAALIVAGRGETGAPGSVRGFGELVERYAPSLGFQYDLADDTLLAIGRWCWAVGEHTDEHGIRIIYKAT